MKCSECKVSEDASNNVRDKLMEYLCNTPKPAQFAPLAFREIINREVSGDGSSVYRIVHKNDIEAWQLFLREFRRKDAGKKPEPLDQFVKNLLSPGATCLVPLEPVSNESNLDESDKKRLETLSTLLSPIVCSKHRMPIRDALFDFDGSDKDPKTDCPRALNNDRVAVLDESTYDEYLVGLVAVTGMIQLTGEDATSDEVSCRIQDAHDFRQKTKIDTFHPVFRSSWSDTTNSRSCEIFSLCSENLMGMKFNLMGSCCADQGCNQDFVGWEKSLTKKSQTGAPVRKNATKSVGSGSNDAPIVLDSDAEDGFEDLGKRSFSLRVFEFEAGTDVETAQAAFTRTASSFFSEPRRSRRSRRGRFPDGPVQSEISIEVRMDHNVAALRLAITQGCTDGSTYELKHTLRLFVTKPLEFPSTDIEESKQEFPPFSTKPRAIDLAYNLNSTSLLDICENVLEEKLIPATFNPSVHMVVVRQPDVDVSAQDMSDEMMMEELIDCSNLSSGSKEVGFTTGKSKSTTRTAERGFTGTLLSGAPMPKKDDEGKTHNVEETNAGDSEPATKKPKSEGDASETYVPSVPPTNEQPTCSASGDSDDSGRRETKRDRPTSPTAARSNKTRVSPAKLQRSAKMSGVSVLERLDSHDNSDSDDSILVPAMDYSKSKRRRQCEGDSDHHGLAWTITERLMKLEGVDAEDQSKCFEAAQWAVCKNPSNESEASLVDVAYSKYIADNIKV